MKIINVRRISQIFFFLLFLWLILVNSVGENFWQIRGWPVNIFLEMDPLIALGNILSTHTLYSGLAWALLTVVLTFVLGRFFCSWVCPFGTLHHGVSYLAHRQKGPKALREINKYRNTQKIKYIILIVFLVTAAFPFAFRSLQIGLLDPIAFFTRSMNLTILPLVDNTAHIASASNRFYEGAWLVLLLFGAAVLLNLWLPRFYCRYICPLGALLGVLGRFAVFRIGRNSNKCSACKECHEDCVGGCEPSEEIHHSECLLCLNCTEGCTQSAISYQTEKSQGGEITGPGVSRKQFLITFGSSLLLIPAFRLAATTARNWYHKIVRPPGALQESAFLERCIKCGQCMRICPTNIIQPGELQHGLEVLWTPVLNFRIGTSGCQLNCVACGQVCPTAAIRPITLDEKVGRGTFEDKGPIKMGTAFMDRGRCLPWAMKTPCIVCQENCPVSPKAIFADDQYEVIPLGNKNAMSFRIEKVQNRDIHLSGLSLTKNRYSTGDYYIAPVPEPEKRFKIKHNTDSVITVSEDIQGDLVQSFQEGQGQILVHLQRPFVHLEYCTGCGICEHECPVTGLPAIRITAEGETRDRDKSILLERSPSAKK